MYKTVYRNHVIVKIFQTDVKSLFHIKMPYGEWGRGHAKYLCFYKTNNNFTLHTLSSRQQVTSVSGKTAEHIARSYGNEFHFMKCNGQSGD